MKIIKTQLQSHCSTHWNLSFFHIYCPSHFFFLFVLHLIYVCFDLISWNLIRFLLFLIKSDQNSVIHSNCMVSPALLLVPAVLLSFRWSPLYLYHLRLCSYSYTGFSKLVTCLCVEFFVLLRFMQYAASPAATMMEMMAMIIPRESAVMFTSLSSL